VLTTNNTSHNFLPVVFKKIGLAIILLSIVFIIAVKLAYVSINVLQHEVFRVISFNAILLGLLLIAISKDKTENETSHAYRLKAFSWTFTWTVLAFIIRPLVDLLAGDAIDVIPGQVVIMNMLLGYLLLYYSLKKISNTRLNKQKTM
jgi:type IV secretory pathway VirB3-like protein